MFHYEWVPHWVYNCCSYLYCCRLHVDAAWAGVFALLPELRQPHFRGLELADSFATNPHKVRMHFAPFKPGPASTACAFLPYPRLSHFTLQGLLTNFDCCAMWVRDSGWVREALSLTPEYLRAVGNELDYKDWQVGGRAGLLFPGSPAFDCGGVWASPSAPNHTTAGATGATLPGSQTLFCDAA